MRSTTPSETSGTSRRLSGTWTVKTQSVVNTYVCLFGGWAGKAAFGDLFCFDLDLRQWSRPQTTHSVTVVGPRCGHSCVAVDGGMVVIGGWNGERDLSSIRTLNLATLVWESEQVHQSRSPFVARHGHTAVTVGNEIHLYGGSSQGKVLSELATVEILGTEVFQWGLDAAGQTRTRPEVVPGLSTVSVTRVSCGARHCGLVSTQRELFQWGPNKDQASPYRRIAHGCVVACCTEREVITLSVEGDWKICRLGF